MKTFFISLILACFGLNYGYSQTREKISIPVLKESVQIDSLIDLMLNHPQVNVTVDSLNRSKDDWITLTMTKMKDDAFGFSSRTESKVIINYSINGIIRNRQDSIDGRSQFGCFTYKKFKVFVWTNGNFYGFFSKSRRVKSYAFIYKSNLDPPNYLPPLDYKSGSYTYKKNNGFKLNPINPIQ